MPTFAAAPPPLTTDADGVIRVAATRVTLDVIVAAFDAGATAEEIALQFPTLSLAAIDATLAYVVAHSDDVRAYLDGRASASARTRADNERRADPNGVRARLLARRPAA